MTKECDASTMIFYIVLLSGFVGGMLIMLALGVIYSNDVDKKKQKVGNICYIVAMVLLVILFAAVAYQTSRT
jgi:uncharacterized membrane-anchored protein